MGLRCLRVVGISLLHFPPLPHFNCTLAITQSNYTAFSTPSYTPTIREQERRGGGLTTSTFPGLGPGRGTRRRDWSSDFGSRCGPWARGALSPALGSRRVDGAKRSPGPSPLVHWLLCSMAARALPGAFLCCPLGWSMAFPYYMGVTGAFPVCS